MHHFIPLWNSVHTVIFAGPKTDHALSRASGPCPQTAAAPSPPLPVLHKLPKRFCSAHPTSANNGLTRTLLDKDTQVSQVMTKNMQPSKKTSKIKSSLFVCISCIGRVFPEAVEGWKHDQLRHLCSANIVYTQHAHTTRMEEN